LVWLVWLVWLVSLFIGLVVRVGWCVNGSVGVGWTLSVGRVRPTYIGGFCRSGWHPRRSRYRMSTWVGGLVRGWVCERFGGGGFDVVRRPCQADLRCGGVGPWPL